MKKRIMRTAFVLTTIVLALALGVIAGVLESRLLTRILIIGFVPAIWTASHLVERVTGRYMWHLTAPYPYSWMSEGAEAASAVPVTFDKPVEHTVETGDGPRLPLAA
jgi:hypothetical protein